jgi:hypothetical protein
MELASWASESRDWQTYTTLTKSGGQPYHNEWNEQHTGVHLQSVLSILVLCGDSIPEEDVQAL